MNIKKTLVVAACLLVIAQGYAQQASIKRIDMMSNKPSPYKMLDWKQITLDYDNFVFNINLKGQYLPLVKVGDAGVNYPEVNKVYMATYVGHNKHPMLAEGINILPAIVGATLVGVDKTNQYGVNWVAMAKEYFNKKNGELLYLNNINARTGGDWWYEVMPSVFFYQLYALYPHAEKEFAGQFNKTATVFLEMLKQLGAKESPWTAPYMNYRSFNKRTGKPRTDNVPEPETAGSIAWIMYQAYIETGNAEYLKGARWALDFLQGWDKNPSYELQLPYGILTAARMNAELGTHYDIQKFLDWAFSSGKGTLRQWGCIVGNWGGYDVSGLIGEANDNGDDYAFIMNGFQHAAALLPLVKYDKRYARALAKWTLNLANASRLFYHNQLPAANQEPASYQWAKEYDKKSCIPFESMKEKWNGNSPVIMGDAVKGNWAKTDLSLYSGSSVGYMASLLSPTNVEGILQIDLNKTDFRGENNYPVYLYYNPYNEAKKVRINLPNEKVNVYDAISEKLILTNVAKQATFSIDADHVRMMVVIPASAIIEYDKRFVKVKGGGVIDFQFGNY